MITRNRMIEALINHDIEGMGSGILQDILEHGIKGYAENTDEEIQQFYAYYVLGK